MNNKALDAKRIKSLKEKLLQEKRRLEQEIKDIERMNLHESQSEISGENSYVDHLADAGTVTFDRERDLSLERNVKDILNRVNNALDRIDKKTYGLCARCGQPIDPARLKALPYADLCIECKKREEESW